MQTQRGKEADDIFQTMIERITIEPGKRSGQPCIRGLRITVWDALSWLAAGMSAAESLMTIPIWNQKTFAECMRT
jgi:uncharacterized protein (DUF433 family)